MTFTTRPANPQPDFPRIAELLTVTRLEATTADELHEDENRHVEGKIRRRAVAVGGDGQITGYGYVVRYPSELPGHFHALVAVDPNLRNTGIGSALYDDALHFALGHGATIIHATVREESREALRFAQNRGFAVRRHAIESTLDLSGFDASRFEGLVESVEAGGIRFFSLADAGNTTEAQRRLYEINRIASTDDPASTGDSFPSFDVWLRICVGASDFQPEGQLLAAHGDTYVGMTGVTYNAETNTAESLLTGVHRDYRGRKIAQALKLLTIRFAQAHRDAHITAENDSQNAPMPAINRKFGYEPRSGYYGLINDLRQP